MQGCSRKRGKQKYGKCEAGGKEQLGYRQGSVGIEVRKDRGRGKDNVDGRARTKDLLEEKVRILTERLGWEQGS